MKLIYKIFLFIGLGLTVTGIDAQVFSKDLDVSDSTQVHIIETVRGDVLVGHVTRIEGTTLYFLLDDRIPVEFQFAEVKSVLVQGEDEVNSKSTPKREGRQIQQAGRDSFSIQYMTLTSTAFPLEKGNALYTNIDLLWNTMDWGVTDNFTAGVGLYLVGAAVLKGKLTFGPATNFRAGVGTNIFVVFPEFDEFGILTNVFGVATFGPPEKFINFTGGAYIPTGRTTSRAWGGSFGFGGEKEKFTYRAELYILSSKLTDPDYQASFIPELVFGLKRKHRRFEAGVISMTWTDFPIIPYLAYKAQF